MRDRLIELLKQGDKTFADKYTGKVMSHIDELYDFIADYLLANGVIVPPVTIGQKVWELCQWKYRDTEIREGKISMIQQKADKSWKIRISVNHFVYDITPDKIGKTIFLTREEAEAKLKGGEG